MSQFIHHREHSLLALGKQNHGMMWIEKGLVYCVDCMEHEYSVWAERRVFSYTKSPPLFSDFCQHEKNTLSLLQDSFQCRRVFGTDTRVVMS